LPHSLSVPTFTRFSTYSARHLSPQAASCWSSVVVLRPVIALNRSALNKVKREIYRGESSFIASNPATFRHRSQTHIRQIQVSQSGLDSRIGSRHASRLRL